MSNMMDQARDTLGEILARVDDLPEVPPYVKAASAEDACGHDNLPYAAYALPVTRAYPTHTKAATWLSAFYLAAAPVGDARDRAVAEDAVSKAAAFWDIEADVRGLRSSLEKAASAPEAPATDAYALAFAVGDKVFRACRLASPEDVRAATTWCFAEGDKLASEDRRAVAGRVLDAAEALGVPLSGDEIESLERRAGRGTTALKSAASLLRDRASRVGNRSRADADELLKAAEALGELTPPLLPASTAAVLDDWLGRLDRRHGVVREYDAGADRPCDVLFAVTPKSASVFESDHVLTASGTIYRHADLERATVDQVESVLGTDAAAAGSLGGVFVQGEKLAAVLSDLAEGEAEAFDLAAREWGVLPLADLGRPELPPLSASDLDALA